MRSSDAVFVSAYGIGDDEDVRLRGVLGSGLCEVADDGGVGVEEV
jgi:hypothetical protein